MEKYYKVKRVEIATEKEVDYGSGYTMQDVKDICKGYHPNETFNCMWERSNGKYLFFVDEE